MSLKLLKNQAIVALSTALYLFATCGIAAEIDDEVATDGLVNEEGSTVSESMADSISADPIEEELGEHIDGATEVFVGPPVPEGGAGTGNPEDDAKPRIAENIDLSQPIAPVQDFSEIDIGQIAPPMEPVLAVYAQKSLTMLGAEVFASTSTRLEWSPAQSFAGIAAPTPVLVVNGAHRGPTLCVTAAIHGDELNGIEVVRRVLYELEPEKLSGAVIGVPIVNLQGFRRASRYLPDRRDLNRYFPGNPSGSSASRLAHSFFTEVISHCDALVDLHTGSFQRTNLPQLRADLKNPQVVELTQGFGSTVVLHSDGANGTLRRAASDAGIPTITLEAGGPARIQNDAVTHSTKGVMTLLNKLDMYDKVTRWGNSEPIYYRSRWVRADQGGVLFSKVKLGERVKENQLLGTITDPITNVQTELRASNKGRVLGMALDQFVMPGFASFRIGIEAPEEEISEPTAIDMAAKNIAADSPNSPSAFADAEVEFVDEYEEYEDDEVLDSRDNLEDSE